MRTLGVLIVLLGAGLAGCVDDAPAEAAAAPTRSNALTGSIHGFVVDDNLLPVSAAVVTLQSQARQAVTKTDGSFAFSLVPIGDQVLIVQAAGYQSVAAKLQIIIEETSHVDITIERLPTDDAYHALKIGQGLFGCGFTYRQGFTTVNGAFFGISGCGIGATTTGLDNFTWRTELSDRLDLWRGAAFETEWRSTQAFGNGMVQDWAVDGCANNRNATFTRDAGPSPLREIVGAFQLDYRINDLPNSSCEGHTRCNLDDGCMIMNRMFSWPSTQDERAIVDVGVTLQQTFITYITEFYREEPPRTYTAIPDA